MELDGAGGIGLKHLLHAGTEMVMYGGTFPNALVYSLALAQLIVKTLAYNRQALNQEHAAQDRQEQLLVYAQCSNRNYTANGKAACIAHEYLCRI